MAVKWDLSKYQSTLPSLLGLEPATILHLTHPNRRTILAAQGGAANMYSARGAL